MKTPLPRHPDGTHVNTMPLFLLRSAVEARTGVNGAGLALRAACVLVALTTILWVEDHPVLRAAQFLPIVVGVLLAFLEWREAPIDAMARSANGGVSRTARWLASTRERATASVSGVLEVVIGPLVAGAVFAGPWAAPMPILARVIGLIALTVYVGDTLVQVVTDVGYYNHTGDYRPHPLLVLFRRVLPVLATVVLYALLQTTSSGSLPTWVPAALACALLVVYLVTALADTFHTAALRAHALSLEDALVDARERTTSDIHRLKSTIRAQNSVTKSRITRAYATSDEMTPEQYQDIALREINSAIEEIWLQTELVRVQSAFPTSHLTLQQAVDSYRVALDLRGHSAEFQVETNDESVLLDAVASDLMRHLVLDLVDNSCNSASPSPRVQVKISTAERNATVREWFVSISDSGPGFIVPSRFPPYSSTRYLQRQCQSAEGSLEIVSTSTGTGATGRFVSGNLGHGNDQGEQNE